MPTVSRLPKKTRSHVRTLSHPLLAEHISFLRSKDTPASEFKRHLKEASKILILETLKNTPRKKINIQTPLTKTRGDVLAPSFVGIAILRAGLGLLDGLLELLPETKVGHIGIFRDEDTLKPMHYYTKLPQITKDTWAILLDPMLATGGSAVEAIKILKENGARVIKFVALIAVREGVNAVAKKHPDVEIVIGAIDPVLNIKGYIVPGLGDCGDRLFGT